MPEAWNQKKIGWYLTASEHTGFHSHLARQIVPILRKEDTLCDLGCGPGRMALEFAPYVHSVTAIDSDPTVIRTLDRQVKSRGIKNISAVCSDVHDFQPPEPFDVVMMCFFGDFEQHADFYFSMCRKKLIYVLGVEARNPSFKMNRPHARHDRVNTMKAQLAQAQLPYELMHLTLEFGQPLTSPEDGMLFVSRNSPGVSAKDVYTFLAENMIRTGRSDYPLYLPDRKELALFIIDCQNERTAVSAARPKIELRV